VFVSSVIFYNKTDYNFKFLTDGFNLSLPTNPAAFDKAKNNILRYYTMSSKFNRELWNVGRKIEDAIKPKIDEYFGCEFQRSDDIYDVMDFRDEDKKIIVEVKGRRIPSTQFKDTIITCNKFTEALIEIENGYEVYFFFVFTDKTLYHKVDEEDSFMMKMTGTFQKPHYLIPVKDLKEFEGEN
tara:strand:- start:477 stop:1025 length:549 start_codon:yes stop_codon:yes gene_type:complete